MKSESVGARGVVGNTVKQVLTDVDSPAQRTVLDVEDLRQADVRNRTAWREQRIQTSGRPFLHAMSVAKTFEPKGGLPPLDDVARVGWPELRRAALASGVVVGTRDPDAMQGVLTLGRALQKKGIPFVSEAHMLGAVRYLMDRDGLEVPSAEIRMSASDALKQMSKKEAKTVYSRQGKFFRGLLRRLDVQVVEGRVRFYEIDGEQREDITDRIDPSHAMTDPMLDYGPLKGAVAGRLDRWLREPGHERVVAGVINTGQFKGANKPIVQLVGQNESRPTFVAGTVATIPADDPRPVKRAFRSLINEERIRRTRAQLEDALIEGAIPVHDGFDLHDAWPRHALMDDLREKILPLMNAFLEQQDVVVDPQDLEHQILFRLTTLSPKQIYQGGEAVVRHLQQVGAYDDWQNISKIDPEVLEDRPLNEALIQHVIEEQFAIIADRLERAGIDLGEILATELEDPETGEMVPFFSDDQEKRWRLEWYKGGEGPKQLVAVSPEGVIKNVELKLVDQEMAELVTFNLHYIHTLRADGLTFGMYVEGMDMPFAVETTEFTDRARQYKQNAYLLNGYHPHRGIELTRLYTLPGGPLNIIGVIDGAVSKYVKQNHPEVEFVSTTVMPTYAKTKSTTIAGGIDTPCLVKTGQHKFAPVEIGGRACYEHLTNRRAGDVDPASIIHDHPEFPLLPVLEVVNGFGAKPSFRPARGMEGKMIERRKPTLSPVVPKVLDEPDDVAKELRAIRDRGEEALGEVPWVLTKVPPRPHPVGTDRTIRDVAARLLGRRATAFMNALSRWKGPKVEGDEQPYVGRQETFRAVPFKEALSRDDLETVLKGNVLVMKHPARDQVQLVARDHHTVDALLYLYDSAGYLPRGALHLDRHSDYEELIPEHGQANGWWSLLPFFLRPGARGKEGPEILSPRDVIYGTAVELDPAKYDPPMPGELNGAHENVPPSHDRDRITPEDALARAAELGPDFLSIDLDLFMPAAQDELAGWVLDDPRYQKLVEEARAVLFVLSPQFAKGGDWVKFRMQATPEELGAVLHRARA